MEILTILATGSICLLCFLCGYKCRNKEDFISKETINNIAHPIETYKDNKAKNEEKKKNKKRQLQMDVIMDNLEKYDGTANSQQKVPFFDDEENEEYDEEDEF